MKRSAIYARVSSEEQALEGTSIDLQVEKGHGYAGLRDWGEVSEYVDAGYSGGNDNRPQLQRLMQDVEADRVDVVIVWKLDRFFRNLRLLLEYKERLDEAKVAFVSVSESVDTSSQAGRLLFNILGSIAEWERESITERTKEGRRRRFAEGKWAAGKPPYGYRYNPETKGLDIREDEARVVRRIYQLYVHDRLGQLQVARQLNTEGVPGKKGSSSWHNSSVRDTLVHPCYKGKHPKGVEVEPIVEESLWELAQKRRKDNPKLHRREGSQWLLQAMVKCGVCGRTLNCAKTPNKAHPDRRTYTCTGRWNRAYPADRVRCTLPRMNADWLEREV